jgi:GMP synthase (glutamine-hydrolysing)
MAGPKGATLAAAPEASQHEVLTCTVVRHVEIEDLGYLGAALERNGLRCRYVDADRLPAEELVDADCLIVLGGPMGVYEQKAFPFLAIEIDTLRRRLAAGRPVLGICLGAQLLAAAAGARVYPGRQGKEIGWAAVELTEAAVGDPIWDGLPARFVTFHWHGDTFDLPVGAELIARSSRYPQAFRLGASAVGVQFHPEVVPHQLEAWARTYHLELQSERLTAADVLSAPDLEAHRTLAFKFGDNVARWLRNHPKDVRP